MSKKETTLTWDAFKQLGNPDNAPEMPSEHDESGIDYGVRLRVFLDRKSRGGKEVTIVRGFAEDHDSNDLKQLGKTLKQKCGVGGAVKNGEVLVQGNHRDKVCALLLQAGYKDVKQAGG